MTSADLSSKDNERERRTQRYEKGRLRSISACLNNLYREHSCTACRN